MTDPQRQALIRWNKQLAADNRRLLDWLRRLGNLCGELMRANTGLRAELAVSELWLNAAIRQCHKRRKGKAKK